MLLRVPEVAKVLDVSVNRTYQLVREGLLPAVKMGYQIRIDEEQLQAWISAGGATKPVEGSECRAGKRHGQ